MRLRGRRVALLLAGALPLVADDSKNVIAAASVTAASGVASSVNSNQEIGTQEGKFSLSEEEDETDFDTEVSTVEAIHHDAFRLPTLPTNVIAKGNGDSKDDDNDSASSSLPSASTTLQQEGDEEDDRTIDSLKGHRNTTPITPAPIEELDDDTIERLPTTDSHVEPDEEHIRDEETAVTNAQEDGTTTDVDTLEASHQDDSETATEAGPFESETTNSEDEQGESNTENPNEEEATKEETSDSENTISDSESSDVKSSGSEATSKDGNEGKIQENSDDNDDDNSAKMVNNNTRKDDTEEVEVDNETIVEVNSKTTQEVVVADEDDDDDDEQADDEDENSRDKRRVDVDYASKSAGALILEKSSSMKGTSNLLNGDKDKYAIAPCEDKKFVVIGLSEDILVKKIILVNYERYSSRVKDFKVLASQNLGTWQDLGTYTAKAGNGEQVFELMEPAWARYLKFRFLTHHGSEHFCTVSQIKVHGSTMLQGFHEQWEEDEASLNEDDVVVVDNTATIEPASSTVSDTTTTKASVEKDAEGQSAKDDDATATEATNNAPNKEESSEESVVQTEVGTDAENNAESTNRAEAQYESSTETGSKDATEAPTTMESTGPAGGLASNLQTAAVYENVAMVGPFRESEYLNELLRGNPIDEELFTTIYELIPTLLDSLPSGGRTNDDSEIRTPISELGTAALQSLYTSTLKATDVAKSLVAETSGTIVAPKMTDAFQEMFRMVKETVGSGTVIRSPELPDHLNQSSEATEEVQLDDHESHEDTPGSSNENAEVGSSKNVEASDVPSNTSEHDTDSPTVTTSDKAAVTEHAKTKNEREQPSESVLADHPVLDSQALHSVDLALAKMLDRVPSADCLTSLDYAEFKAKLLAARKGDGSSPHSSSMEPIFKKLTGEIKSLQLSLSVHDQFTKASVSCYQRILLDLIVEMETMRLDQNERLLKLENEFHSARSSSIMSLIAKVTVPLFSWLLSLAKGTIYIALSIPKKMMKVVATTTRVDTHVLRYMGPAVPLVERVRSTLGACLLALPFLGSSTSDEGGPSDAQVLWALPLFPIIIALLCARVKTKTGTSAKERLTDVSADSMQSEQIPNKLSHEDDQLPKLTDESVTEARD